MSLHTSGQATKEPPNFFWLSDLTYRDILFGLLKPNSSKGSLNTISSKDETPFSRFGTSMSSVDTAVDNSRASGTSTLASANLNPSSDQLEKGEFPAEEDQWKPGKKEWLVMVTLAVSSLIVALDALILVPVLPILSVKLNGSANQAFWAGTSYLLTSAAVQPFIASLSDIFGRRELLVPSLLLFTVASIICGVADNFTVLLVGRVMQGVGGGGVVGLSQVIYGDIIPLRQRPKYFSVVQGAWAIGTLLGPIIGGAFAQEATWRWCFYINLPICAIATVMACFFLRFHTERKTILQKLRLVDWVGGFAFTTSLTATLYAISSGGIEYPWSSWRIVAPLTLGLIGTCLTLAYECCAAKNPFLQRSLFPNVSGITMYLASFFQGMLLFMLGYYGTFYFSSIKFASPLMSGVKLTPAVVSTLPSAVVASSLITRRGTYRWALWIGWAMATLGCGLLILFKQHTHEAVTAVALVIVGLGLGILLSAINFAIQASVVDTKDSGRAAGMYAFMRTLGMTVGVAIGGTIFQNSMKTKLEMLGLDTDIAANAEAFVINVLHAQPHDDDLVVQALKAYVHGLQWVFVTMTIIAGVAMFMTILIKEYSMDKILESKFSLEKKKGGEKRDENEREMGPEGVAQQV